MKKRIQLGSRMPTEITRSRQTIRRRQYGFDRLAIWFDHPAPDLGLQELDELCGGGATSELGAMRYNQHWKSSITLLQPSRAALKVLAQALVGAPYNVQISYAELACDLITGSRKKAEALRNWLLGCLWIKSSRQHVALDRHDTTYYYHRRANGKGRKSGKVLALYADWASKLSGPRKGQPCCHIEFRLSGAAALKRAGIVTIGDLVDFEHAAFWEEAVCLARWTSKADLGRFLDSGNAHVSGTALRKRANAFIEEYESGDAFVLQNALIDEPGLRNITEEIDPTIIFRS